MKENGGEGGGGSPFDETLSFPARERMRAGTRGV